MLIRECFSVYIFFFFLEREREDVCGVLLFTCCTACCKARCDWANWPTTDWYRWLLTVAESGCWPWESMLVTEVDERSRLPAAMSCCCCCMRNACLSTCNALTLLPRCPVDSPRRPVYIGLCINQYYCNCICLLNNNNNLSVIKKIDREK